MGSSLRPGIVQNDLVLAVDAYNPRSYPGSGGTWYDLSGNNLNLTGNASYMSNTGLTSGAAWSTVSTDVLNTDCHTISFTLKLIPSVTYTEAYSGNWDKIFTFGAGGSDRTPSMWRFPSERTIHYRYDPSNTGHDFNTASGQFAMNTWYHITCVKTGATTNVYLNGTYLSASTVSSPKTRGTSAITLFESYTANLAQVGCLHIYRRPLSATEIAQNFTAMRGNYGI
jgi:hypothetical protein